MFPYAFTAMNYSPSLRRRLVRLNVPAAILLLLLQRAPMLRVLISADSGVITAPVSAALKSAVASLGALGVPGTLVDPKLALFTANSPALKIGENDTYSASLPALFLSVGAFAFVPGAKDAALIVSLPPGGYTVQVSGADGGTGEAIVEVYEIP